MLSIIDIILISIGGLAVVIYATLKIHQVVKFKKLTKQYMDELEIEELDARKRAYEYVYHKRKKATEQEEEDEYEE